MHNDGRLNSMEGGGQALVMSSGMSSGMNSGMSSGIIRRLILRLSAGFGREQETSL